MILTNIFGKKVNAESFSVELIRGRAVGEYGRPVLILMGERVYQGKYGLLRTRSMLKRDFASPETMESFLDLKDKYEEEQEKIDEEIKQEAEKIDPDKKMWLEYTLKAEKGYLFYEKDENFELYEKYVKEKY